MVNMQFFNHKSIGSATSAGRENRERLSSTDEKRNEQRKVFDSELKPHERVDDVQDVDVQDEIIVQGVPSKEDSASTSNL